MDSINHRYPKALEFVFYTVVFFPYLISPLATDTAPYALILSFIITVFYFQQKQPFELLLLLILTIFVLIIFLLGEINFQLLRSLAGYFSMLFIASATYYIAILNNGINKELIFKMSIVWLIVGFIQQFYFEDFLTILNNRTTTTVTRGITSLAPEPTYYATMALFFLLIANINKHKILLSLCVFFFILFFLSQSATVLFISVFAGLLYCVIFLTKYPGRIISICTIFFVFSLLFYNTSNYFNQHSRLLALINKSTSIDNVIDIFVEDDSAKLRAWEIFVGFKGAYDNYFIPNGFNKFTAYYNADNQRNYNIIINPSLDKNFSAPDYPEGKYITTYQPSSGIGRILFELGVLGLVYIYILAVLLLKYYKIFSIAFFLFMILVAVMTTAVPIAFPPFSFLYGLLIYKIYSNNHIDYI